MHQVQELLQRMERAQIQNNEGIPPITLTIFITTLIITLITLIFTIDNPYNPGIRKDMDDRMGSSENKIRKHSEWLAQLKQTIKISADEITNTVAAVAKNEKTGLAEVITLIITLITLIIHFQEPGYDK